MSHPISENDPRPAEAARLAAEKPGGWQALDAQKHFNIGGYRARQILRTAVERGLLCRVWAVDTGWSYMTDDQAEAEQRRQKAIRRQKNLEHMQRTREKVALIEHEDKPFSHVIVPAAGRKLPFTKGIRSVFELAKARK